MTSATKTIIFVTCQEKAELIYNSIFTWESIPMLIMLSSNQMVSCQMNEDSSIIVYPLFLLRNVDKIKIDGCFWRWNHIQNDLMDDRNISKRIRKSL